MFSFGETLERNDASSSDDVVNCAPNSHGQACGVRISAGFGPQCGEQDDADSAGRAQRVEDSSIQPAGHKVFVNVIEPDNGVA
jgi:hypothetical protein